MTEEYRESVPVLTFPRQTLVSLLVFAVVWETLSHLAPYLGIPAFAIPSFARIAKSRLRRQLDFRAHLTGQFFHADHIAGRHPVLLSAGLDNRMHLAILLSFGEPDTQSVSEPLE